MTAFSYNVYIYLCRLSHHGTLFRCNKSLLYPREEMNSKYTFYIVFFKKSLGYNILGSSRSFLSRLKYEKDIFIKLFIGFKVLGKA